MNVIIPKTISLTSSNVTEALYSDFNIATSYSIGNKVYVRFESDGTTPLQPHKIYESLTNTNVGNYPPDDTINWLDSGASNKWAMFDDYVSSQTENATSIYIVLATEKADKLCFFNLLATSIQIVVKDTTTAILSDETIDLTSSLTASWSEYFFDDIEYKDTLIYVLPAMYLNLTIEVTINHPTTAKCGHLVLGQAKDLGLTEYGVSAGIIDYSRKETNVFGETEFVVRAFAKTLDIDLWIDHTTEAIQYDRVHKILSDLRATPVVWDVNNTGTSRQSFQIFGFYKDFDLVADYATKSACSLFIEGLI